MATERPFDSTSWIEKIANELATGTPRVVPYAELTKVYQRAVGERWVKKTVTQRKFLETLARENIIGKTELQRIDAKRSTSPRTRALYTSGQPSTLAIALGMRPRSYVSHGSAMMLNGLTSLNDFDVYVNQEQTPKPPARGTLVQSTIDRAFQNPPRISNYRFKHGQSTIVLLSGKNTGNYAVSSVDAKNGYSFPVTSVARTLVDITVRPVYAGGIANVLEAYIRAASRTNHLSLVRDIAEILKVLDHVYPYHQAVGFYLERANVTHEMTDVFFNLRTKFDFYLDYRMKNPDYDKRWQIYFPRSIN